MKSLNVSTYLGWIEKEIQKQYRGGNPKSLYEPQRYILRLGGKRIRPLLVLFAYQLFKKDAWKIIPYAVAVEIFHNFTLMHDDIMDNAPLRRGKRTVHKKWNESTAILSGDAMLVNVYSQFAQLDSVLVIKVLSLFNAMAIEVCEGQQWDMEFEKMKNVSKVQYMNMIKQKTAVLLGFSLEFGGLLAGANADDQAALRKLGISAGIGFQLRDDLLDVYGGSKEIGKQNSGDILANKKTFLLITALEKAKGKEKSALEAWLRKNKFDKIKKIEAVKSIFNKLHIRELTEQKINDNFKTAFQALESISISNQKKSNLKNFLVSLIGRQS